MSFEIHLLAINQNKPVYWEKGNGVLLHNEIDDYEVGRYGEIWPFFSKTKGILYSLVEEINEDYYVCFNFCRTDVYAKVPQNLLPIWIPEDAKEFITPFTLYEDVKDEIIEIIQFVAQSAPEKRILFLTGYEGGEVEIVFGVLKMSKFLEMLNSEQILFNVCYILECD